MPPSTPRLSVVMPVHNGEPYVGEAIGSILDQTLTDFELIIVENGSTDGSRETARAACRHDPRLRLIEHPAPLGIVGAANAGIAAARAPLVARQDQDDISHPARLQRQVAAFEEVPGAVAVGTLCEGIDAEGRRIRPRDRWRLVGRRPLPPFPHGSVCLRRDAFERVGGYREGTRRWEDVDLFLRLVQLGPILVLPDALYRFRYHARSQTTSTPEQEYGGEALVWEVVEEFRRGADWTHLLGPVSSGEASGRVAARVRHHQDGLKLWSGVGLEPSDPAMSGALLPGARLRRAWQRTSPATLRRALSLGIRVRDLVAAPLLRHGNPISWRPR